LRSLIFFVAIYLSPIWNLAGHRAAGSALNGAFSLNEGIGTKPAITLLLNHNQCDKSLISKMNYLDRITFRPEQCGGRPCIRGMRIRVKDVLDLLAAGLSEKEILEDYPDLETEDIKACLQYAAAQANHAVLRVS
jgi:uncharacterized protein (DUF433 family)